MKSIFTYSFLMLFGIAGTISAQDGIPIEEIKRTNPVDFDKEILPALRQNCLACHNSTDAEGDIILESVAKIMESEAVVAGKPDDSSLLKLSAHLDDPVMPPEDNEVKAKNLSSNQLGLIKLWISQGAKPSANSTANKVVFAALPPGVNPVYALSMSPDGQFLAAGRANQIFVYRVPSKQLMDRVTDPGLLKTSPYKKPGVAHLDIVQSLAFSPDNQTFVSGGFRNIKIWKRSPAQFKAISTNISEAVAATGLSADKNLLAIGGANGTVFVWDLKAAKLANSFKVGDKPIEAISIQPDGKRVAVVTEKRKLRLLDATTKKMVGREIALEQDGIGIVFSEDNQRLLVALGNNGIAIYPAKVVETKVEDKVAPEKVLNGHAKTVTRMIPFAKDSKLLTASGDGTAKIWNLANGQQIRTFSHGTPVSSVDISADEARVVTCGTNGSVKIFNAANSAVIKEVKGDPAVEYRVATLARQVRLKQQLIDVAKRDLDAATKEKTAEEANVKKTEEALKKAGEELKAKLAAKTKADTAYDTANQAFEKKKVEVASLQKSQMELMTKLTAATQTEKKMSDAVKAADLKLKQATTALAAIKQKATTSAANLAKDAKNADLKKAADAAAQALTKAETDLKTIQAAKVQADTNLKPATAALNGLKTQKAEVDKKVVAANAEVKKMEPNIKKLADAKKKATDEHTASSRNQTLAKNSVDRAKVRAKKAADKVPVLDGKHKAAIADKAAQDKTSKDFQTANASRLAALTSMVQLENGDVFYQDAKGNSGTCDGLTGEKLDSIPFPQSAGNRLLWSNGNQVYALASDGKTLNMLTVNQNWTLAKTIGSIEDINTFVDRVTALDVSSDGKLLATGSGEPSRSGIIKIWNLADGKLVKEIKDAHSDTILDLKFSPDGSKIASASSDRFMKTFNLADGKLIRVFEGHTHHVMSVDWNSTGRDLSTAGADKVVKVWDAETGTQKRTIAGYGKEVTSLSFVELTNNIVTACGDKTVRMKRTDNGGEVRSFAGNADFVYAVATSANGKKIASGGEDSVVRIWNDNGQLHVEFKPPQETTEKVSSK